MTLMAMVMVMVMIMIMMTVIDGDSNLTMAMNNQQLQEIAISGLDICCRFVGTDQMMWSFDSRDHSKDQA